MNPIIKNRFSLFSCLSVISFAGYLFLYVLRIFFTFLSLRHGGSGARHYPFPLPSSCSLQRLHRFWRSLFSERLASCYRGSAPSISSPKTSTIIPSFPQFKLIPLLLIPSSLLLKPTERSKAVPQLELRVHFLLQVTEILNLNWFLFNLVCFSKIWLWIFFTIWKQQECGEEFIIFILRRCK